MLCLGPRVAEVLAPSLSTPNVYLMSSMGPALREPLDATRKEVQLFPKEMISSRRAKVHTQKPPRAEVMGFPPLEAWYSTAILTLVVLEGAWFL